MRVAWEIVKSLGLRTRGVTVVACPTCGRLDVDNFVGIVEEIERRLAHIEEPLHLSIMGCAVNGPGEAHDSQLGITFGRGVGMIFKDGVPMRKVAGENIVEAFVMETEKLLDELKKRSETRYVPQYALAALYNGLGDTEKALDSLEKALTDRDSLMVFLKVEPKWDNLRSEPRFIELMKKMNFD